MWAGQRLQQGDLGAGQGGADLLLLMSMILNGSAKVMRETLSKFYRTQKNEYILDCIYLNQSGVRFLFIY